MEHQIVAFGQEGGNRRKIPEYNPAWKVIEPMDTQIKGFADSMYEQSFVESAVSTRADTTSLLKQRTAKRTAKTPIRESEINGIVKFQVQHIERCLAARLESYERAYEETGKVPTEEELEEILAELKTVGDLQVKHSSSFIDNFLRARRAQVQCDPEQSLMEGCAEAHDRVLRTWKNWGEKIRIKEVAPAKIKAAAKPPAQTGHCLPTIGVFLRGLATSAIALGGGNWLLRCSRLPAHIF